MPVPKDAKRINKRELMEALTSAELQALRKVLNSTTFQNLIGAEEWEDISEDEEFLIWRLIDKFNGVQP